MKLPLTRIQVSIALLIASLLLICLGSGRSFKVYENTTDDWGIATFTRVHEAELIVDSTFSGIERKAGKLYTTYNRLEQGGKRACPT